MLVYYAQTDSKYYVIPIPSNLTKEDFTVGMVDNSNYIDHNSLSGTDMNNYSSGALAQDATINKPPRKPPVSETGLKATEPLLVGKLPCQIVHDHPKPSHRPSLPENMPLVPETYPTTELDMDGSRKTAKQREFLIGLIRSGMNDKNPQIWSAIHTLVSSVVVLLMRIGFVPVVPEPITKREVVRKCLENFQSVLKVWQVSYFKEPASTTPL